MEKLHLTHRAPKIRMLQIPIIDEAADIAWLGVEDNAGSLGEGKTLVFKANIDMVSTN